MSEGEIEIMAHIMAIETFMAASNKIEVEKWNEILDDIRKRIVEKEEQKNGKMQTLYIRL